MSRARGRSGASCRSSGGRAAQRGWRTGTPHGHPRRSWQSTRGSALHRSSAQPPCPSKQRSMLEKAHAVKDAAAHLLGRDGALICLAELLDDAGVAPEILLAADEDDREARAEVHDLGDPLWAKAAGQHGRARRQRVAAAAMRKTRAFSWTLSSESGESTAKQMRMTCESGYESGRRRS